MRTYGWIPDRPDHRDLYYSVAAPKKPLPSSVDLRSGCPIVYDQGELGSCTANAIAAAIEFDQKRQKLPVVTPSRLFIYYNERVMEGTVLEDAGAVIRDGMKSVNTKGACSEFMWPYNISKFAVQPPLLCYYNGKNNKVLKYQRVSQTLNEMKVCLAAGFPFVFGFTVYESFESDAVTKTGIAPMPSLSERALGGHAVLAVGYDDSKKVVLVRNSWGSAWGMAGYFTLPYNYVVNPDLASDFWTASLVQ